MLRNAAPTPPAPPTPAFHTHLMWNGIDEDDPYLWLEDSTAPAVQQWVQTQHDYTEQVLAGPLHDAISRRITQLVCNGQPRLVQTAANGVQVYRKTSPGDIQPKVFTRDASGNESLLLDPLQWDAAGHTAIDWFSLSPDGRYLAYATSSHGTDDQTVNLVDVHTHQPCIDTLTVRRPSAQQKPLLPPESLDAAGPQNTLLWAPDGKSFYYADYNPTGYFHHVVGTDPSKDVALSSESMGDSESASSDGHYVAFSTYVDWSTQHLNVYDMQKGNLVTLPSKSGDKQRPKLFNGTLYVATVHGDGNGRLEAIDPANPTARSRIVLPEIKPGNKLFPPPPGAPDRGALLHDFAVTPDHVFGVYLHNNIDRIMQFDKKGHFEREIPLPSKGTVESIDASPDGTVQFTFDSLTVPTSNYRYDPAFSKLTLLSQDQYPGYNPADYTIDQIWSTSKDGTILPVLLAHRKDAPPGSESPMVESGYGGFDVNNTSQFYSTFVPLMERGGTYALVTTRGGGEFGEAWHRDGELQNKQNVFDDFIGAAQTMMNRGLTSPEHLGAWGGSNGGLLMGAVVTQAPNLFKAIDIEVPLLDMDRFDQITDDSYVSEYGTTQDPQQAKYLDAYSPYQHAGPGAYPAVIIETGTNDPRVGPAPGRKFAARLQANNTSGSPILYREDADTGHEAGTPVDKRMAEIADAWTLLLGEIS